MESQKDFLANFVTGPFEDTSGIADYQNYTLCSLDGETPFFIKLVKWFFSWNCLSEIGEHWMAGVLGPIPAIYALLAPTVSRRKHFTPGDKLGWMLYGE